MAAEMGSSSEPAVPDSEHAEESDPAERLLCPFRRALQDLNGESKTVEALSRAAKNAGRTPNSKSTMHAVQQCVRLPAAGAVAAYVSAVTDDNAALVDKFVKWRDSIAAELKPDTASDEIEPSSGGQWTRRRLAALVTGTAVVSAVITALLTAAVVGPDTAEPTAETGAAPQTGDDPIFSGCSVDAVRANAPQTVEGMSVFVVYSPTCNAVWGKIERTDGSGAGDSISVVTYRGNDPTRSDTQRAVEPGVGNAYSPLIVRSGTEPICVTGSVTVDNGARTIELPEPQCT